MNYVTHTPFKIGNLLQTMIASTAGVRTQRQNLPIVSMSIWINFHREVSLTLFYFIISLFDHTNYFCYNNPVFDTKNDVEASQPQYLCGL